MDAPQAMQVLPIVFVGSVKPTEDGLYIVARVDCPAVGLNRSYIVLDPLHNRISLVAECGCQVDTQLSHLVMQLSKAVAFAHPKAATATPGAPALADQQPCPNHVH